MKNCRLTKNNIQIGGKISWLTIEAIDSDSPMKRRGGRRRKKVCVFCGKENNEINYKDAAKLKRYVSERGKILPRRITGTLCKTSESSHMLQSREHVTLH